MLRRQGSNSAQLGCIAVIGTHREIHREGIYSDCHRVTLDDLGAHIHMCTGPYFIYHENRTQYVQNEEMFDDNRCSQLTSDAAVHFELYVSIN